MPPRKNPAKRDAAVQELLDQQAILQVLYNYCKGLDRFDYDLLNNCWWPEGTDDHGIFTGTGTEFCNWVFPFLEATMERTQHNVLNTYIEVQDDQAHSECNFIIWHRMLPVKDMNLRTFIKNAGYRKAGPGQKNGKGSRTGRGLNLSRLNLWKTLFFKHDMITAGRYIDEFECRQGAWKIKHRQVVYDWDRMDRVVDYYSNIFLRGERGRQDYSYSRHSQPGT